jgi:hypothetical protein
MFWPLTDASFDCQRVLGLGLGLGLGLELGSELGLGLGFGFRLELRLGFTLLIPLMPKKLNCPSKSSKALLSGVPKESGLGLGLGVRVRVRVRGVRVYDRVYFRARAS